MNRRLLLALGAILLFGSCTQEALVEEPLDNKALVSTNNVTLSHFGGSYYVSFSSEKAWTLSNRPGSYDWLSLELVSGREGSGQGTVVYEIKADKNVSEDRIPYTFQFVSSGSTAEVLGDVTVSQDRYHFDVRQKGSQLPANGLTFSWADNQDTPGSFQEIDISGNLQWKVELDRANTFVLTKTEGGNTSSVGTETVVISPRVANYEAPLTVTATFTALDQDGTPLKGDAFVKKVVLFQPNMDFTAVWADTPENDTVALSELGREGGEASTAQVRMDTPAEVGWTIGEYPDWLEVRKNGIVVEPGARQSGGSQVLYVNAIKPNSSNQSMQEAVLTFSPIPPEGEDMGLTVKTLKVQQKPFTFQVENVDGVVQSPPYSYEFPNYTPGATPSGYIYSLYIRSSGDVEATNLPDWLQYNKTPQADGRYRLDFTLKQQNPDEVNPLQTTTPVSVHPVIFAQDAPASMSPAVQFSQKAFTFFFDWPEEMAEVGCYSRKAREVVLRIDSGWQSSVYGYLNQLNPPGSTNAGEFTVKVSPNMQNYEDSDRESIVTIMPRGITGVQSKDFKMVQKKYFTLLTNPQDGNKEVTTTLQVPATASSEYVLHLKCSGHWELEGYPEFLVPQGDTAYAEYEDDGQGGISPFEGDIVFVLARNTTGQSRTEDMVIAFKKLNPTTMIFEKYQQTISVTQTAH